MDFIELDITRVTSDFYAIRCGLTISKSGNWSFQSNILNFNGFDTMILNS